MICLNRRRIRQRASDSKQQAGNRKNGDRKHEASSNPLKNTKNFVFHSFSPLFDLTAVFSENKKA